MPDQTDEPFDFSRFKGRKKQSLKQIIFESHALSEKLASTAKHNSKEGIRLSKRFQKALTAAGHTHLAKRILNCADHKTCGSTYCPSCRSELGAALYNRTQRNIVKRFGGRADGILANVLHVTGHVDVASIDPGQIRPLIAGEQEFLKTLVRDRPWLRIEGAFELELFHFKHMDKMGIGHSPVKGKQIGSMVKGTLTREMYGDEDMVVYVHWHALIAGLDDVKGRGLFSPEKRPSAREALKARYSGHRRLFAQPLYPVAKKSIAASISSISKYPFKDIPAEVQLRWDRQRVWGVRRSYHAGKLHQSLQGGWRRSKCWTRNFPSQEAVQISHWSGRNAVADR